MGHQCRLKPYQNFHESQKFGPRKIFKLAQCLPPRCLASPDTWPPTDRARDGRGKRKRAASPPGGRTTRGRATQPQTPTSPVQTVARQRVSPRLSALPPRPPPPCCPSIIRIFSPHLLDTCMNEEIDKKKRAKLKKKKKKKKKKK